MNRIERQCNPVQGAAWGQTPTLDLQLGMRYRSFLIEAIVTNNYVSSSGKIPNINDVLGLITLKIGGNPQRTHMAWELDMINRSYGARYGSRAINYSSYGQPVYVNGMPQTPQAGNSTNTVQTAFYLPIFLREPWRSSYAAKEMMGWYTSWADGSILPSMSLEIAVPAAPATGNVYPTNPPVINVYAEFDNAVGPLDAKKNPVAAITKWKRQGLVYGGNGALVINTLPKTDIYTQISLFSAYLTGYGPYQQPSTPAQIILDMNDYTKFDGLTHAKVEVNNQTVRDVDKKISDLMLIGDDFNEASDSSNAADQFSTLGGIPADRLDIVFDKSDLPTDGLVMQANGQTVQDFRITATIGSPGNATAVASNKTIQAVMQLYGAIEK